MNTTSEYFVVFCTYRRVKKIVPCTSHDGSYEEDQAVFQNFRDSVADDLLKCNTPVAVFRGSMLDILC